MKKEMENKEIKSGIEIIGDFFKNINELEGVDQKISNLFFNLYEAHKFTDTHIKNGLTRLREEK